MWTNAWHSAVEIQNRLTFPPNNSAMPGQCPLCLNNTLTFYLHGMTCIHLSYDPVILQIEDTINE